MTPNDSQISRSLPRRDFIKQVGYAAASTAVLTQAIPALAQDAAPTIIVALVGCAHIHTPSYVNILKNRKDVKVKCVWDHDHARAEKNAAIFGCPVVDDLKTVWSDPEIKAVVICSETNRHRELVIAAAEAKKHMF